MPLANNDVVIVDHDLILRTDAGDEIARIDHDSGHAVPVGSIDCSLYRDDIGLRPVSPGSVSDITFDIGGMDDLLAARERIEATGVDVIGPVDHHIFKSIYFFDPNGHRLELCAALFQPVVER